MQLPHVEARIGSGRIHVAPDFSGLDVPIIHSATLDLEKGVNPSRVAAVLAIVFGFR